MLFFPKWFFWYEILAKQIFVKRIGLNFVKTGFGVFVSDDCKDNNGHCPTYASWTHQGVPGWYCKNHWWVKKTCKKSCQSCDGKNTNFSHLFKLLFIRNLIIWFPLKSVLKVRKSQNEFFKPTFPPKKRTKEFYFTSIKPQVDLFSFVFWRKSTTPKNPL